MVKNYWNDKVTNIVNIWINVVNEGVGLLTSDTLLIFIYFLFYIQYTLMAWIIRFFSPIFLCLRITRKYITTVNRSNRLRTMTNHLAVVLKYYNTHYIMHYSIILYMVGGLWPCFKHKDHILIRLIWQIKLYTMTLSVVNRSAI